MIAINVAYDIVILILSTPRMEAAMSSLLEVGRTSPDNTRLTHQELHRRSRIGAYKSGQRWSSTEDRMILADDRPPDSVLAAQLKRSLDAIETRRYALTHGLVPIGGVGISLATALRARSAPNVVLVPI